MPTNPITFTGNEGNTTYVSVPFRDHFKWLENLNSISLDTETNVTDSILDRKLKVIAIATERGKEIWVIQWDWLAPFQKKQLIEEINKKHCTIQNVSFDYQVFKSLGYGVPEMVYDTMLGEQIQTTGLDSESGYHGLQAIYQRRFAIDISKDAQLTFGDTIEYSDEQIEYAAIDVLKLGTIRILQQSEMKHEDERIGQGNHKGLRKTMWWENEFVKPIGDLEFNGIRLDKEKWYAIEDSILPTYEEELAGINQIAKEDFKDILVENNWISDTDDFVEPIWSSAAKKKLILTELYNFEIDKTAKTELKELLKEHDPNFPEGLKLSGKAWASSEYPFTFTDKFAILKLLIAKDKENEVEVIKALDGFLMTNMKSFCIEHGWLRPAGEIVINWDSWQQRLKIFQGIDPLIQSTGKDIIEEYMNKHRLIPRYLMYGDVAYQLKQFGKQFYDKHVELDGKHRTRYNQVLSTGRLSSVSPNILNIPRKKQVFREAVIPDPGYNFINSDFDGQELVITAYLSGEPLWMDSLAKGYDTHSKNAELIFGEEWKDATETNCAYYSTGPDGMTPEYKKCKCEGHDKMRDASKAISFGMLYGATEFSLAPRLDITVDRARDLMTRFFDALPAIKNMMESFGQFAVTHGYIIEPVFGRVRKFEKWKLANAEHHDGIRRQAKNFPKRNGEVKYCELLENPVLKDAHGTISSQAA